MNTNETVVEIMKNHDLMSLASVDAQGNPRVRSVDFVMGDSMDTLFFITNKMTGKVKQLSANSRVAISIDHDCPTMEELAQLAYVKGEGKAYLAETPEESAAVFGRIIEKFPHLKGLPGDPSDFVGVKVVLDKIQLTDNRTGFGNTVEIA